MGNGVSNFGGASPFSPLGGQGKVGEVPSNNPFGESTSDMIVSDMNSKQLNAFSNLGNQLGSAAYPESNPV